ncbi:MAG: DHH family phosphoesterase [Synergistaceae bacterium]|nr:DHH family phosphoesterase [Synergistaceae bacterium]
MEKMMMTMTNEILILASDTLKAHDSWIIFIHKKADGDAVGSATALIQAGMNLNKRVKWYSPDEKLPETYKFLSYFDVYEYTEEFAFSDSHELYIFLDCSNESRSVKGYDSHKEINSQSINHHTGISSLNINHHEDNSHYGINCEDGKVTDDEPHKGINALNIDHHEDNSHYCKINCVDGKASSTCEVLYRIFSAGSWNITKSIAESLYTGIFTDTGSFTFSNTSPLTHRILAELIELGVQPSHMADMISQNKSVPGFKVWADALSRVKTFGPENIFAVSWLSAEDFRGAGADLTENEGLPSMLMTLRGVKFIAMLTENLKGEIRASFRSREGSPFCAGEFARLLGGGGHERASGSFVEFGTLNECVNEIESLMLKKYHECINPDK